MNLTATSYIAGQWQAATQTDTFQAFNPAKNQPLEVLFHNASEQQVNQAVTAAEQAFVQYRKLPLIKRAEFLETIAEEVLALGDELITTTMVETNLPRQRLEGERGRTVNQLKAFATALRDELAELQLEKSQAAEPQRQPIPKPKTQLKHLPVGVVAVFGASNFPYAFSTLGGDTAAALAAGCPVVYKGHPAHPATCELMTRAIAAAVVKCDMPAGVFSMLQAKTYDVAHWLVKAPAIKAVGFTGSFSVANALQQTIATRAEPIPFYGELGSTNPQLLLPHKAVEEGAQVAEQLVQSMLMGNGQFCTSPGLWFVPKVASAEFIAAVKTQVAGSASDTLLTPGVLKAFEQSVAELQTQPEVECLQVATKAESFHAAAQVYYCDITDFISNEPLQQEIFGPAALVVGYEDIAQLEEMVAQLDGQLTASVHGTAADLQQADALIEALQYRVGRLIYGQMPTGVEVCATMNHGGPFPASTDVRSTSVGLEALRRFVRPICIQS
ncbi:MULTISPECIES: aldehyde dehydrogenase (NADP(+)) [unclassified Pseudoalteromonas]|uniref:aldehyde dehydrogenase (NADP(+)) n=1 Tax=unclassified Pseudoalteromonas TaxID=194690 RepID=UPI0030153B8E